MLKNCSIVAGGHPSDWHISFFSSTEGIGLKLTLIIVKCSDRLYDFFLQSFALSIMYNLIPLPICWRIRFPYLLFWSLGSGNKMGLDGVMIAGIICWFPQGGGCIVQYLYNENINIVFCVHLVRFMLITRRVIFFYYQSIPTIWDVTLLVARVSIVVPTCERGFVCQLWVGSIPGGI